MTRVYLKHTLQAEEEADGVPDADKEVLREAATEEIEDNSLLNVDMVTQYEVLDEDGFNKDIAWVHDDEVNTRVEETDHSKVHLRLTTVTVRLRLPTWKHSEVKQSNLATSKDSVHMAIHNDIHKAIKATHNDEHNALQGVLIRLPEACVSVLIDIAPNKTVQLSYVHRLGT